MKRTDARVRYTQKVLKEALLVLLQDKPINKITVKEICDLAELNRATFYTHYRDCFDLLESMERELVEEFRKSMELIHAYDVSSLTEAIYGIAEKHQAVCRVLVFGNNSTSVLDKMIDLAHDKSLAYWRTELHGASEEELEMLYIHLSNGLLHVFVEGYDRYDKADVIRFMNRIVASSLALFR